MSGFTDGGGVVCGLYITPVCQWWIIEIIRVWSVDLQMGKGLWLRCDTNPLSNFLLNLRCDRSWGHLSLLAS